MVRFIVLFLSLAACTPARACNNTLTSMNCIYVLRVVDGDTFTVNLPGNHPLFGTGMGVRILGIDAPEIHSKDPCEKKAAQEAKELLESVLLNAKQVDLKNVSKDKYFRILAEPYADGVDVGQLILSKGLAVSYFGGTKVKVNWCGSKTKK